MVRPGARLYSPPGRQEEGCHCHREEGGAAFNSAEERGWGQGRKGEGRGREGRAQEDSLSEKQESCRGGGR